MARARETWILNGLLVTQDSARTVRPGCLRVVDGTITEILSRPPKKLPAGAQRFDAAGLAILPGLVQAHVHLCQTLFRNLADDLELLEWLRTRIWPLEASHTEETLYLSALAGIAECLSTGTTAVLDMGTVKHTEAVLQAVADTGIRASVGKCLMDHPETTPTFLRESSDRALSEAVELHKRWNGRDGGRIAVSYAPRFVVSCTEGLLKKVASLSRDQGAVIHTHASENRSEIELVRKLTGRDNVEYLHGLGFTSPRLVLAHCVWLTDAEKKLLLQTGTHVAHCPGSNLKLASGVAPVPEFLKMGINVALGCDGAPCNNSLDAFGEMRLAATVHKPGFGPKAVRAQEALDLATLGGAKALGWEKTIGSLEVGKRADFFAIDLLDPAVAAPVTTGLKPGAPAGPAKDPAALISSLVYAASGAQVRATWVDGRLVYRKAATAPWFLSTALKSPLMGRIHSAQAKVLQRASKLV